MESKLMATLAGWQDCDRVKDTITTVEGRSNLSVHRGREKKAAEPEFTEQT